MSNPTPHRDQASNPFDLTGKLAIITGGNGGIGLGMALGMANAGANIAILARNAEKSEQAAKTLSDQTGAEVLCVTADLAHSDQIELAVSKVLERFGRIDILVNNAAISIRKPPQDYDLDEWRAVIEVNLTSVLATSKYVYPAMKRGGRGKIINIGSMNSIFGSSYASAYATSKGGVVQLTKSLAVAWAPDQIQVNAILPGWIDTELTQKAREYVPGLHERIIERAPVGRWGTPADLAGTAVWLASSASDFVTGVAVPVDGGYSSALL